MSPAAPKTRSHTETCTDTRASIFYSGPMTDKSGSPVAVPEFTFPPIEAYRAQLGRKLKAAGRCRQAAVGCSVEADAPSGGSV